MKVIVEYEFNDTNDLEAAIKRIDLLLDAHIRHSGCKKEGDCGETSDLTWLKANFAQALKQRNNATYQWKEEK